MDRVIAITETRDAFKIGENSDSSRWYGTTKVAKFSTYIN